MKKISSFITTSEIDKIVVFTLNIRTDSGEVSEYSIDNMDDLKNCDWIYVDSLELVKVEEETLLVICQIQ